MALQPIPTLHMPLFIDSDRSASTAAAPAHGLLAVRGHAAVRRGVHRRLAVQHPEPDAQRHGQRATPLQAFLFVVFGIYFAWFWAKGQTLAMKTWNIRVVDRHGRPPDAGARAAALRAELAVVPAAAGRAGAVQAAGRRIRRAGCRLGGRLGACWPLSPAAAVLA